MPSRRQIRRWDAGSGRLRSRAVRRRTSTDGGKLGKKANGKAAMADRVRAVLAQIPKFGLVVVLRPRCTGVFCSEKSPIVPQLFCSVILIVKPPDSEDEDDDEYPAKARLFWVRHEH